MSESAARYFEVPPVEQNVVASELDEWNRRLYGEDGTPIVRLSDDENDAEFIHVLGQLLRIIAKGMGLYTQSEIDQIVELLETEYAANPRLTEDIGKTILFPEGTAFTLNALGNGGGRIEFVFANGTDPAFVFALSAETVFANAGVD